MHGFYITDYMETDRRSEGEEQNQRCVFICPPLCVDRQQVTHSVDGNNSAKQQAAKSSVWHQAGHARTEKSEPIERWPASRQAAKFLPLPAPESAISEPAG